MKRILFLLSFCLILFTCSKEESESLTIPGLLEPVEVIRDQYGVNHIYARNEHDLFMAQGFCAARDRLFQFELWRRQATGTVAELLGERELQRDIGTRLFKFRGNLEEEFNHYHENGSEIIHAYTEGVNAYIELTEKDSSLLTIEFSLLGIKPGKWTPDVVISRHQGLLGNIEEELEIARAVVALGEKKVKMLCAFQPGTPDLKMDPIVKNALLSDEVIGPYKAYRKSVKFLPEDLVANNRIATSFLQLETESCNELNSLDKTVGSNNWVVSGRLSKSGFPLLANDPHRSLAAPSLRYMVHLSAPGWNVVGGGEPTIPGISIGHNEIGAWGLTVFEIDNEDLYVYKLNPENKNQYWYKGEWENMTIVSDTIQVKDKSDVIVRHRYTRHGPVTFIDSVKNLGYAMRCGWLDIGGSPYLASLRMDQATTWDEFREACTYSHIPGENMIWADKEGNIGWQVVGWGPVRPNFSGMVPVPGDGRFEWDGFLPIKELPNVSNPEKGFWATANENLVPDGYPNRGSVGWLWADPYRANRINEVLASGSSHTQEEMMNLQFDYTSIPARTLVPLLKDLTSLNKNTEESRTKLLLWNFRMDRSSVEATLYQEWEKMLRKNIIPFVLTEKERKDAPTIYLSKIIQWILETPDFFGKDPIKGRNAYLIGSLDEAIASLEKKLGQDQNKWQYGQPAYHHVLIKHSLSDAVDSLTRKKLEAGPWPRSGNGSTPGMTGNSENQTSGASFRMVVDLEDWNKSMFTNSPGQSGDPESLFYKNLFESWASDKHFPVYFTREKILKGAASTTALRPAR